MFEIVDLLAPHLRARPLAADDLVIFIGQADTLADALKTRTWSEFLDEIAQSLEDRE